jgi:hypothetical protein
MCRVASIQADGIHTAAIRAGIILALAASLVAFIVRAVAR